MSVVGAPSDPTKGQKVCAINIVFDAVAVVINSIARYLSCRRNGVIQVCQQNILWRIYSFWQKVFNWPTLMRLEYKSRESY